MFFAGTASCEKVYSQGRFMGYIMDVLPVSPGSREGMPDRIAG
jgi:hypothetical protein